MEYTVKSVKKIEGSKIKVDKDGGEETIDFER